MRWFKPIGVAYLPVSVAGGLVTVLALAFCVNVFLVVDAHSHSVSDTLYGVFPFWAPTFLLWAFVAERTSRGSA